MSKVEGGLKVKAGFTLIEMLVASLLLGMLMTVLTMVFNSSAIAWRTGKASISEMSQARRQLSFAQRMAEDALPGIDENSPSRNGVIRSAWKWDNNRSDLRKRAVEADPSWPFTMPNFSSGGSGGKGVTVPIPWSQVNAVQQLKNGVGKAFTVGVWSYGPDGKPNTADDISTWPDETMIE